MKGRKTGSKLISLILALVMIVTLLPATAMAAPGDSGTADNTQPLEWKDIPGGTYYERTQSMETDGEYVILYQGGRSENRALHNRSSSSDVNGQSVEVSQENGQYTITDIDEYSTWRIDNGGRIYCTVDGRNYYLSRDDNNANLTTKESSALTWSISGRDSGAARFNTESGRNLRSLRWYKDDFKIRSNEGTQDLYLYEKHTATGGQAALTGTLSHTVKVGGSLTEDQIKQEASVLYREAEGVEEAVLDWNNVAVSWDKALDTNTVGAYTMTVSYQDIVLGSITVNVQETVLDTSQPNWGLDAAKEPYPEYPDDGAVRIDKTAIGDNFNSTGAVKVELDTAGISVKQGVDVVLVVDVSNSMGWTDNWFEHMTPTQVANAKDNVKIPQYGTPENTTDKLDQAMRSAQDFADILLKGNENGSKTNNSISFVTFAGFDADNTNESGSNRNYIDSVQTVFTNVQDAASANRAFSNTKFTKYSVDGTSVDYTLQIGGTDGRIVSGINRGNTNYDYAFAEANKAVEQLKNNYGGADKYEETGRETIVVFMTDGAPSHYNGNRLNGKHADTLYGTNRTYAAVGAYNGNAADNEDTWLNYILSPNTYAETLNSNIDSFYAVGFDLDHGGFGDYSWSQGDLQPVLEGVTGTDNVDVTLVENGAALLEFYNSLANQIMFAGTNAVVTDTINSEFTLQTTQETGTGDENATHGTLTEAPAIEVTSYELYTKATTSDETLIGTRTGKQTTLEKVVFNEDGTEAYIEKTDPETGETILSDNIMTSDGEGNVTIAAEYFTYTKEISEDGSAVEKFVWNIGDITDDEVVLSYYAYLTGSMEGTRKKGDVYYTNEGATLEYVDINGDYAKKDYPMPAVAWGGASTSYEYYLVNEKGEPVNRAGQKVPFANRIVIYGGTVGLNLNQDATIPAQRIDASVHLPEGYYLYDVNAYYTVSTASSAELDKGITVSEPSKDAYKTTGEVPNQVTQTGAQTTIVVYPQEPVSEDETFIQTRVAFGVRWDLTPTFAEYELVKDQIVIDYGKAVQADVVANDSTIPEGYTGELIGFTAYNANANLKQMQQSAGSKEYTTDNGTYTIVDGKVNFQLSRMLSQVEKVFCVVQITQDSDNTNYYYLYEELDIIPATTVYYETDFAEDVFTLTDGSANKWDDDGVSAADVQDDGTIGVNQTYGYDSTYADDNGYSNGSSLKVEGEQNDEHVVTTTAAFDFTGTGFDLISRTGAAQGLIQVKIYGAGNAETPVKTVQVLNKSESNLELYQIPVVSVNDLSYGTYHVTIEVYQAVTYTGILEPLSRGGEFCFDAVKVYNPINVSGTSLYGDAAVAQAAYVADGEANADITEIRQMIIDKKTFDDGSGAIGENAVVFVDRTADGVKVADYETIGPNNEVYLSDGQGIAFQLSSTEIPASIDIGAKSADGKSVYMSANLISTDNEELSASIYQEIESCTAQNYDLMAAADVTISDILSGGSAYVVIFNTGEGILSITDIKVAYGESAGITSFSVTPDVVNAAAKALGAGMVGEEANYDIQSASFDAASCKLGKNATMTVITTDAVETLKVTDYKGKDVSADITSSSENGQTTWKVSLKMTLMGNRTYTVTGYGADGTAGASADAEIKVTLR